MPVPASSPVSAPQPRRLGSRARRDRVLALLATATFAAGGFLGATLLAAGTPRPSAGDGRPSRQAVAQVTGHFLGSAFAVAPGVLVTNAHVTAGCQAGKLPVAVTGQGGVWQVATENADLDLALLTGPAEGAPPPLSLSAAARLPRGMEVLVLGYPVDAPGKGPSGGPHATTGSVRGALLTVHRPEGGVSTSFAMTDRAGREIEPSWEDGISYFGEKNADRLRWAFEIAAPTGHGGSGGPVVDGRGGVVGVVFAGEQIRERTSAVSLADLREFLTRAGVVATFAAPAALSVSDWRPVYAAAAPSVVQIGC